MQIFTPLKSKPLRFGLRQNDCVVSRFMQKSRNVLFVSKRWNFITKRRKYPLSNRPLRLYSKNCLRIKTKACEENPHRLLNCMNHGLQKEKECVGMCSATHCIHNSLHASKFALESHLHTYTPFFMVALL